MTGKEREEWVSSLKAGDVVAYDSTAFTGPKFVITRIDHITPSGQIATKTGKNFWPKDGMEITSNLRRSMLTPVTPDIRNEIKRYKFAGEIRRADFDGMPMEKLERIYAIIQEEGR